VFKVEERKISPPLTDLQGLTKDYLIGLNDHDEFIGELNEERGGGR